MQKIRYVLSIIYQTRCVFFSISFLSKNDDDIVRGGGGGRKVIIIGIIISENDDNCGPPNYYNKFILCIR